MGAPLSYACDFCPSRLQWVWKEEMCMFYQLKPTFEAVQEKPAEGVPWVEVITQREMDSQVTQRPYLARSLRHGHSCKAELFDHCAAGALLVPRKEHSPRSGHSFAFLLTADHLTFVDDTGPDRGTVGTAFLPARTGGLPRGAAVGISGAPHPGGRSVSSSTWRPSWTSWRSSSWSRRNPSGLRTSSTAAGGRS